MRYLIDAGFEVIPVRPSGGEILGQPVATSLAEIDGLIDLVDVFRRGDASPDIAHEAVSIGASALWLQPGCVSEEARIIAAAGGLAFVQGECTMQVHRQLVTP